MLPAASTRLLGFPTVRHGSSREIALVAQRGRVFRIPTSNCPVFRHFHVAKPMSPDAAGYPMGACEGSRTFALTRHKSYFVMMNPSLRSRVNSMKDLREHACTLRSFSRSLMYLGQAAPALSRSPGYPWDRRRRRSNQSKDGVTSPVPLRGGPLSLATR